MINLALPWWEYIVRAMVVYFFLLVGIRLAGRRQVGQLSPFDFVLLLILSNAVQNSMNGGDNSLLGGLILAGTLFVINHIVGYLSFKSQFIASIVEGRPSRLIHEGVVDHKVQKSELITSDELKYIIRKNGFEKIEDVHAAIIETNGAISVIAKKR